jgi:SAM-dependent methyltransferase
VSRTPRGPAANWADYWRSDTFWKDSPLWRTNAELFLRRATPLLDLREDDTVLDVGCGAGHLDRLLSPRVRKILAVDVAEQFLAQCLANCRGKPNVRVAALGPDYTDLGRLPGGPFSLILCLSVVQYHRNLDEVGALIDSARRVASPGGRMLLADLPRARSAAGRLWDAICSGLLAVREGHTLLLLRAALAWHHRRAYRSFARAAGQLSFRSRDILAMLHSRGLEAREVRTSLSVHANRLGFVISFGSHPVPEPGRVREEALGTK